MVKVRWGSRRAVLSDLSPAATFIAAGVNLPVDAEAFDRRSAEILDEFEAEWGWMYKTTDERGRERTIDYTVWSEVFTCPSCAGPIVFYDVAFDKSSGTVKVDFLPGCGQGPPTKDGLQRRRSRSHPVVAILLSGSSSDPWRLLCGSEGAKKSKAIDDEPTAQCFGESPQRYWRVRCQPRQLPLDRMVHGSRLGPKGFTRHPPPMERPGAISSLSTLGEMRRGSEPLLRHALLFWIEQAMWGLSWMNRFVPRPITRTSTSI